MSGGLTQSLSLFEEGDAGGLGEVEAPELYLVIQADRPLGQSLRLPLWCLERVKIGRSGDDRLSVDHSDKAFTLQLPDRRISSRHTEVVVQPDSVKARDLGSKNGTRINGQAVTEAQLSDGDVIEVGNCFFLFRGPGPRRRDSDLGPRVLKNPELATFDLRLAHVFNAVADVAQTDLGILILGETGSGKEVLARAIHELSERKGALAVLDSGALSERPPDQFLAGRVASDGQTAESGWLEKLDGGTLFLDEVSELPPAWQASLLRVLQDRAFHRAGAPQATPLHFRPLAATHRDPSEEIKAGRLRADLLSRVSGARLELPPLRERKQDLGLMIRSILTRLAPDAADITFRRKTVSALMSYGWPYNVRELETALRYGLARAKTAPIAVEHLPLELQGFARAEPVDVQTEIKPAITEVIGSPPPRATEVRLLGVLEVEVQGERRSLPSSKKVRALLGYLAATKKHHRRERLIALLSEGVDDPRAALRWQLSRLRAVLKHGDEDHILATRDEVGLRFDDLRVDYLEVRDALEKGLEERTIEGLEGLAETFRGGFLEGLSLPDYPEFEAWRTAMEEYCIEAQVKIARSLLRFGEEFPKRVLPYGRLLERLVPDDPHVGLAVRDLAKRAREASVMPPDADR